MDTTGFGIGTPIFLTPFAIERGTEPNLISAEIRSSETAAREMEADSKILDIEFD